MSMHRFAVGQSVRLKGGFGLAPGATGIYRVTKTLPERDDSPQYRIRKDEDRHERVTTEDCLEAIKEEQSLQDSVFAK